LDALDATEDDDGGTKVDRAFAIIILISLARAGGLDFFFHFGQLMDWRLTTTIFRARRSQEAGG